MNVASAPREAVRLSPARFLAYVPKLLTDRAEGLRAIAHDHGDCVRVPVPGKPIYLLSAPEHAQRVLQTNHRNYGKSFDLHIVKTLLGQGLVTTEGELWRHGRQAAQPALRPQCMAELAPRVGEAIRLELDAWDPATEVPAFRALARLSLRVLTHALLGVNLPDDTGPVMEAFTATLRHLDRRLAALVDLHARWRTPATVRFERSRAVLHELVDGWVRERRANPVETPDLLSMLMEGAAHLPAGTDSEEWLRGQLMTYLFAGHETTAVALSWTLWLLAREPSLQEALVAELQRELGDRDPEAQDVGRLKLNRMTITEAMRLYPPVWSLGREAIGEDVVGGYRIPAGATVLVSPYVIQRRADLWSDPDRFEPRRFEGNWKDERHPFSYFPFSGGQRYCIGESFAWMELQLVLAMILRRFEVRVDPSFKVRKEPLISMRPVPDIPLHLRRRG